MILIINNEKNGSQKMKKILRKGSDLVGIQAIYRNGELIYREQQTEVGMEANQAHGIDKRNEDNNQRV